MCKQIFFDVSFYFWIFTERQEERLKNNNRDLSMVCHSNIYSLMLPPSPPLPGRCGRHKELLLLSVHTSLAMCVQLLLYYKIDFGSNFIEFDNLSLCVDHSRGIIFWKSCGLLFTFLKKSKVVGVLVSDRQVQFFSTSKSSKKTSDIVVIE